MKTLIILFFSLLVTGAVSAQKYNPRLLKSYSNEELSTINHDKPELFQILNYALDNACYITNATGKDYSSLTSIDLANTETAPCFAELGLKIIDQNQYFRINGTEKLLVVKSQIVLSYEMKNAKK
jgi:hypothetical protein